MKNWGLKEIGGSEKLGVQSYRKYNFNWDILM